MMPRDFLARGYSVEEILEVYAVQIADDLEEKDAKAQEQLDFARAKQEAQLEAARQAQANA